MAAMPGSKLVPMREAIARFVPDGTSICLGTALEALIPFAAGHELIRQRRRDLTLIGPISDMLFDQLVGAGCVGRIVAAWVGNVSAGLGHNYRRAVEQGRPNPIGVEDHSNLSIAGRRHWRALHPHALAPRHRPAPGEPRPAPGR
jgi:glutaconate CoA-transferase subunit A